MPRKRRRFLPKGKIACRYDEFLSVTVNEIDHLEKYIIVPLPNTKRITTRKFTIIDDKCSFQPCVLYRKYTALRPPEAESLRLFLTCNSLNAERHTIIDVPKKIIQYSSINTGLTLFS